MLSQKAPTADKIHTVPIFVRKSQFRLVYNDEKKVFLCQKWLGRCFSLFYLLPIWSSWQQRSTRICITRNWLHERFLSQITFKNANSYPDDWTRNWAGPLPRLHPGKRSSSIRRYLISSPKLLSPYSVNSVKKIAKVTNFWQFSTTFRQASWRKHSVLRLP